tara:strand:- start:1209 stop:1832 length:624 start_codon:yes stop_codon:yes gene_type:complete
MSFEPQLPEWGLEKFEKHKERLLKYHSWLVDTGIKTGLISNKSKQFVWDEFIIHSLYFALLINKKTEENHEKLEIFDIGTGAGIPGIPISIVQKGSVKLIDIKQKRIYELERLIKILNLRNAIAKKEDAKSIFKNVKNSIIVMRCYESTSNILKMLENQNLINKNLTFYISSNAKTLEKFNNLFHVKQEKFLINKNNFRYIDVITDM